MPNFDDILSSLCSDVKVVTKEVGKRAEKTVAISRLNVERVKIKNRVQQNYRRLGEIVYGGYKNEEDISDILAVLFSQLDDDFERIEDIYNELCAIKNDVDVCMEPEWDDDETEADETGEADGEPALLEEKQQETEEAADEVLEEIAEAAEDALDAIEEMAEPKETEEEPAEAAEKRKQSLRNNFSGIDVDAD